MTQNQIESIFIKEIKSVIGADTIITRNTTFDELGFNYTDKENLASELSVDFAAHVDFLKTFSRGPKSSVINKSKTIGDLARAVYNYINAHPNKLNDRYKKFHLNFTMCPMPDMSKYNIYTDSDVLDFTKNPENKVQCFDQENCEIWCPHNRQQCHERIIATIILDRNANKK